MCRGRQIIATVHSPRHPPKSSSSDQPRRWGHRSYFSVFHYTCNTLQVARSATSPSFAYVSNPAPDSSLCRVVAPQLRLLQLLLRPQLHRSASAAAPQLCALQLLLATCVCFSCCSLIVSASTAPRLYPIQLLLPDCVRFDCCYPIVSACSPSCSGRFHMHFLEHSSWSSRFIKLKYKGRASLV